MEVCNMNSPPLINIVDVICQSFHHLDPRLINHGERVAYILMKMMEETNRYTQQEKHDIFMLGLLHDIGAYKEKEIDSMLSFDLNDSMEHSVFGYLLFKTFSPLPEYADTILYHHHCNAQYYPVPISNYHRDISKLIYLADRIDIFCMLNGEENLDSFLEKCSGTVFLASDIRWFQQTERKHQLLRHIHTLEYQKELSDYTREHFTLTEAQIHNYLMTFIFSVDFRNDYTALHTNYAVQLSENLSQNLRMPANSRKTIQLATLLHNIGKISLPAKLNNTADYNQYLTQLYRTSTQDITRDILSGSVESQILNTINESFLLLECWANDRPLDFTPVPAAEIVALSYLMSNSLTSERNVSLYQHPKLLKYLQMKYKSCQMNDMILRVLEKSFDQIIEKTQNACASIYNIYHRMMDEDHSLNMILLHYNNKY
ncbi:HD domain-containing protein [Lachnospiraceae bacterium]|nr:HD domain-containing protein [Lachnospiraceae bacterium]